MTNKLRLISRGSVCCFHLYNQTRVRGGSILIDLVKLWLTSAVLLLLPLTPTILLRLLLGVLLLFLLLLQVVLRHIGCLTPTTAPPLLLNGTRTV